MLEVHLKGHSISTSVSDLDERLKRRFLINDVMKSTPFSEYQLLPLQEKKKILREIEKTIEDRNPDYTKILAELKEMI